MVWCGVEEPLQANTQLFALDEEKGVLRLADFDEPELSRYSFTRLRPGGWPDLIGALTEQADGEMQWVLIWKHETSGPLRAKNQIRLSRLRRQGFVTFTSNSIGVAWLPFAGVEPDVFLPAGTAFHPAGDGAIIIVDSAEKMEALFLRQIESATLAQAGASARFVPGREFMRWMATVNLRIMYLSHDQLERAGLVVLGRRCLDITPLAERGLVDRIESGSRASLVWAAR